MVGSPDPTNLVGAMAFLGSEGGATMGWVHFLAIDLLAGLWISRIADQHGIHRNRRFQATAVQGMSSPTAFAE
jgi:Domain of unknown function (DUF4281)